MSNCSISTTKILVNYTLVNHNVHNPNDPKNLPSIFDKEFDLLTRYINATDHLCDRLLLRTITLSLLLFFLYFYILGSIVHGRHEINAEEKPALTPPSTLSSTEGTSATKSLAQIKTTLVNTTKKKARKVKKSYTNTVGNKEMAELTTQINSLSYQQLISLMSKKYLGITPTQNKTKRNLQKDLIEYGAKNYTQTQTNLKQIYLHYA